uniref:Serpin domain-containing protein n=1 Tax=Setaria digitata TaxID=48799 RepID=A0A915Q5A5_9BILA
MDFALNLLHHSSPADQSVLLSPISIISVLSVLYAGARNKTELEIRAAIAGNYSKAEFLDHMQSIMMDHNKASLADDEFHHSLKFWLQENVVYEPFIYNIPFLIYDKPTTIKLKSNTDQLVTEAASWLKQSALNKANNVLFMNFGFSMFLIAKAHLVSRWKFPFHLSEYRQLFQNNATNIFVIEMMERTENFPYYEDDKVQVVSLPFEASNNEMIIILPKEINEVGDVEVELTGEKLHNYIRALQVSKKILVRIPQIKLRKILDLTDQLQSMGLRSMFKKSARFPGISEKQLPLTQCVKNLASIQVDTEGINAESVENMETKKLEIEPSLSSQSVMQSAYQSVSFEAIRPFFFAILDSRQIILWIGKYYNPEATQDPTAEEVGSDDYTSEDDISLPNLGYINLDSTGTGATNVWDMDLNLSEDQQKQGVIQISTQQVQELQMFGTWTLTCLGTNKGKGYLMRNYQQQQLEVVIHLEMM